MSPSCQASTSHICVAWLRVEDSTKWLEDNTKALGDNIKGLVDNTKGMVGHHILDSWDSNLETQICRKALNYLVVRLRVIAYQGPALTTTTR